MNFSKITKRKAARPGGFFISLFQSQTVLFQSLADGHAQDGGEDHGHGGVENGGGELGNGGDGGGLSSYALDDHGLEIGLGQIQHRIGQGTGAGGENSFVHSLVQKEMYAWEKIERN